MKMHGILALLSLFSVTAWAGTAEITWHEPETYRDIRAGSEIQSRFETRIFDEFEEYFNYIVERLPEGYTLQLKVTDLDLAGEVIFNTDFGRMQMLRVVKSNDFPRIEFSYQLLNEKGVQVKAGEERLRGRELPGQGRIARKARSHNSFLDYEKAMIDRWFYFRFEEYVK